MITGSVKHEIMDEITKYPLFGKVALIKDEVMGELAYSEPGSNCIMHPAFRGGEAKAEVIIYNDVMVRTFGSGSEFCDWHYNNCERCARYRAVSEPTDLRCGGCPLELRLTCACYDNGKIPFKAVKRIGFGRLSIQNNGLFARLNMKCNEFIEK